MSNPSNRLAGRRILLTGGASGIGRATAVLFAREGAALGIVDIDDAGLRDVAAETGAHVQRCDLTSSREISDAVDNLASKMGGLDGIVNCAGISRVMSLDEMDESSWRMIMAVNLDAPYLVCRAALPYLRSEAKATIANVASGQALLPNGAGLSAYIASKAGLLAFTKSLASELAPQIRANVVCPGIVETPMVTHLLEGHENPDDAPFVQQYALKRVAQPEEIAKVLLFLTSDESSFVTGSAIAADGGRTFH